MNDEDIPTGWYPDPAGHGGERWWDGSGWTERARPAPPADEGSALSGAAVPRNRWRLVAAALGATLIVGAVIVASAWSGGEESAGIEARDEGDEQDQAPATEPGSASGETNEPTDLRDVDWSQQPWTTSCGVAAGASELWLTPAAGQGTPGSIAIEGPTADFDAHVYSVDVSGAAYGDLTGDGVDEVAFLSNCVPGNFEISTVEVFTLRDGQVHQVPSPVDFTRMTGYAEQFEITAGALRVVSHEPVPGDEAPWISDDGYPVVVVTDWTLDGDRWFRDEVSRTEPSSPAPAATEWDDHILDGFATPTGNIYCAVTIYGDGLECGIGTGLQPSPGHCEVDWTGLFLPPSGPAEPVCAGDHFLGSTQASDLPSLGYGQVWSSGSLACRSEETGLTCENDAGNGFTLSRVRWSAW